MIIVKINERNFSLVRRALHLVTQAVKWETGRAPNANWLKEFNPAVDGNDANFGNKVASRDWTACAEAFDKEKRPLDALMLMMLALKTEHHATIPEARRWWCYELACGVIEYVILNRISWAKADLKELEKRVAEIRQPLRRGNRKKLDIRATRK